MARPGVGKDKFDKGKKYIPTKVVYINCTPPKMESAFFVVTLNKPPKSKLIRFAIPILMK